MNPIRVVAAAAGRRRRTEILAARTADLEDIRATCGPDIAARYDIARRDTTAWHLQDVGLALADLLDPPPGDPR